MKRRDFVKLAGSAFGAAFCSTVSGQTFFANSKMKVSKSDRPNIILILADDMGFADIGCYGSEVQTPNLDKLAAQGIRFTQFYNSARCCPTRASLLTGLHPHQAGIGWMTDKWAENQRENLNSPAYTDGLNKECITIAEGLKRGGYHTMMSGKWHVGEDRDRGHWPFQRGFDKSFSLIVGASSYFRMNPNVTVLNDKKIDANHDDFYITDEFTKYANKFIEEAAEEKQEPFFMYLAYTSPHWPLHARPEDIEKYRGKYKAAGGWPGVRAERFERMKKMGIIDPSWDISEPDQGVLDWSSVDQDEMDLRMAVYAAQIDSMDQNIGKLVEKLEELDIRDNTLIMFLADNGACAEHYNKKEGKIGSADSMTAYWQSWANVSNVPFRRYKHWAHEGGIATPLIANWPAQIKKHGMITPEPGHITDIMATCLDLADTAYPETYDGHQITPLEGKSLASIFTKGTRPGHDYICVEHEGHRCCRKGKWKLVAVANEPWELYDMEADRTETNDLASEHPDKVAELEADYNTWAAKCNVRPPSYW
ncbi:arylsulfatase [Sedimentisphaera salicampi]|uniref:arylsulfatase n=1 Tax=Sedimentisphaera salicampi TaxID=1941349 RepID=UPI000B9C3A8B|nr:arylsulfatase [Sedimentisphaera salicampi]OXU14862.1 Arylsulfatase [Sedimentisphaera salicampi]